MSLFGVSFDVVSVNRILWGATILAYAVLIVKLAVSRIFWTYRFFSFYLVYRFIRSLVLIFVPYNSLLYFQIWSFSVPLSWVLYVLVVLELYTLVLRNYKGIASLSRWILTGSLSIAITVSAISLVPDFGRSVLNTTPVLYLTVIERGIVSGLTLLLLLITAFLVWYPVPLSRNVIVYTIVYALYFISSNMALVIMNLSGRSVMGVMNLVMMLLTFSCMLMWIFLLNRKGEEKTVSLRTKWLPGQEDELVEQLAAINATLLRSARNR